MIVSIKGTFILFLPCNSSYMCYKKFQLIVLEDAKTFLGSLPKEARKKIIYNIERVQGGIMDSQLFKKLESSNIWEFRTLYRGIAYRLFAFWDTETETLVVATHGIVKKTQKTPSKEIIKAEKIRVKYFEERKK